MEVNIDNDDDGVLSCPYCASNNLHHEIVDIFERVEDSKVGLHVTVKALEVSVNNNMENNPSRRRHGLSITFWCGHCPNTSVLNIIQHKGSTYVEFKEEEEEY